MCCCPKGSHVSLEGKDEKGRFLTSSAQEYPAGLCETLAKLLLDAFRQLPQTMEMAEFRKQLKIKQQKTQVPGTTKLYQTAFDKGSGNPSLASASTVGPPSGASATLGTSESTSVGSESPPHSQTVRGE